MLKRTVIEKVVNTDLITERHNNIKTMGEETGNERREEKRRPAHSKAQSWSRARVREGRREGKREMSRQLCFQAGVSEILPNGRTHILD